MLLHFADTDGKQVDTPFLANSSERDVTVLDGTAPITDQDIESHCAGHAAHRFYFELEPQQRYQRNDLQLIVRQPKGGRTVHTMLADYRFANVGVLGQVLGHKESGAADSAPVPIWGWACVPGDPAAEWTIKAVSHHRLSEPLRNGRLRSAEFTSAKRVNFASLSQEQRARVARYKKRASRICNGSISEDTELFFEVTLPEVDAGALGASVFVYACPAASCSEDEWIQLQGRATLRPADAQVLVASDASSNTENLRDAIAKGKSYVELRSATSETSFDLACEDREYCISEWPSSVQQTLAGETGVRVPFAADASPRTRLRIVNTIQHVANAAQYGYPGLLQLERHDAVQTLRLAHLSVDYAMRPFVEGEIVKVDGDHVTVNVAAADQVAQLNAFCRSEIDNWSLSRHIGHIFDTSVSPDQYLAYAPSFFRLPRSRNKTPRCSRVAGSQSFLFTPHEEGIQLSDLAGKRELAFVQRVSNRNLVHLEGLNRSASARRGRVFLENVHITSAAGKAVHLFHGKVHVLVDSLVAKPAPGQRLSVARGGVILRNVTETITVRHSHFERIGDDAVNTHAQASYLLSVKLDRRGRATQLLLARPTPQRDMPPAGLMQFVAPDTGAVVQWAVVESVRPLAFDLAGSQLETYAVTLSNPIDVTGLNVGFVNSHGAWQIPPPEAWNTDYTIPRTLEKLPLPAAGKGVAYTVNPVFVVAGGGKRVHVHNNRFIRHRGRGVLLRSLGAYIHDNHFAGVDFGGVVVEVGDRVGPVMGPNAISAESAPYRMRRDRRWWNLVVEDNVFSGGILHGRMSHYGMISVGAPRLENAGLVPSTRVPVHHRVWSQRNAVINSSLQALNAERTQTLVTSFDLHAEVGVSRLTESWDPKTAGEPAPWLEFSSSSGVSFGNMTLIDLDPACAPLLRARASYVHGDALTGEPLEEAALWAGSPFSELHSCR